MTRSTLDHLLATARATEVRGEVAATAVAAITLRPAPVATGWRWATAAALVLAAGALTVVWLNPPRGPLPIAVWPPAGGAAPAPAPVVVALGARVAMVASPGAHLQVVAVTADATAIEVVDGTVTVRLWPGPTAHALTLRGGGVSARATGTVYALTVRDGVAAVDVHEGTVAVADLAGGDAAPVRAVRAGRRWEPSGERVLLGPADAAAALLAAPAPPTPAVPDAATGPDDAGPSRAPDVGAVDGAPSSAKDRYRRARLARAQGDPVAALAELTAVVDTGDATWAPLAMIETLRIELDVNASPERAIAAADTFAARWPGHSLAAEVRALRCRARQQLGLDCD